jgi:hypothetical protein
MYMYYKYERYIYTYQIYVCIVNLYKRREVCSMFSKNYIDLFFQGIVLSRSNRLVYLNLREYFGITFYVAIF